MIALLRVSHKSQAGHPEGRNTNTIGPVAQPEGAHLASKSETSPAAVDETAAIRELVSPTMSTQVAAIPSSIPDGDENHHDDNNNNNGDVNDTIEQNHNYWTIADQIHALGETYAEYLEH